MLLDTHALLWFLNNDARLPKTTSQKIEEAEFVFVSIVSIWEIAIKANIGKLTLLTPFETIQANTIALNIREIPISFEDTVTKKLGLKPRRSRAALIDYMYFMVDMVS